MTEYRYTLARDCDPGGKGRITWVMLNPSTADDTADDQTVRRIVFFSTAAHFRRLEAVNLFAARATDPADLAAIDDPVGPLNDLYIETALATGNAVAIAWGSTCPRPLLTLARNRRQMVLNLCRDNERWPLCLGVTSTGQPRHPSRLGDSARLRPFGRIEVPA